jgi:hypothetical protein
MDFCYAGGMKNSEHSSAASSYTGHVKNGVIVLDVKIDLQDGQPVRVEPLGPGPEAQVDTKRADHARRLQELFSQWTEEDGKLSDEEAGRLHAALNESRGLRFGSPLLD